MYRKFSWLHNRVLLHLQAELATLEHRLQDLDDEQRASERFRERICLYSHARDNSNRKQMLAEIKAKLAEYDDLVFRLKKKNAMKRPTRMNQNSVCWPACMNSTAEEAEWIFRTDDLVTLVNDDIEQGWFHLLMSCAFKFGPRSLMVRLKNFP